MLSVVLNEGHVLKVNAVVHCCPEVKVKDHFKWFHLEVTNHVFKGCIFPVPKLLLYDRENGLLVTIALLWLEFKQIDVETYSFVADE